MKDKFVLIIVYGNVIFLGNFMNEYNMKSYDLEFLRKKKVILDYSLWVSNVLIIVSGILAISMGLVNYHHLDNIFVTHLAVVCGPFFILGLLIFSFHHSNTQYEELYSFDYLQIWKELLLQNNQELTDTVKNIFEAQGNRLLNINKYNFENFINNQKILQNKTQNEIMEPVQELKEAKNYFLK